MALIHVFKNKEDMKLALEMSARRWDGILATSVETEDKYHIVGEDLSSYKEETLEIDINKAWILLQIHSTTLVVTYQPPVSAQHPDRDILFSSFWEEKIINDIIINMVSTYIIITSEILYYIKYSKHITISELINIISKDDRLRPRTRKLLDKISRTNDACNYDMEHRC
jgi:hypothetical protein